MKIFKHLGFLLIIMACSTQRSQHADIYKEISTNPYFSFTKEKALVKRVKDNNGFNWRRG